MELFVVKNRAGKVVENGFSCKRNAKEFRNILQGQIGMPSAEVRMRPEVWDFTVSKGKDHRLYANR